MGERSLRTPPARQAVGDEPDDNEREEEGLQVGDTPAAREPRGEPDRVESPGTLRRAAPEGDHGIDSRYEQDGEERRLDPVTDRGRKLRSKRRFPISGTTEHEEGAPRPEPTGTRHTHDETRLHLVVFDDFVDAEHGECQ